MLLDDILEEMGQELNGLECSAVVGLDGLVLVQKVIIPEVDIFALTVEFSAVFIATKKAGIEIGDSGNLMSIHTFKDHYVVMQGIEGTDYFIIVCLRSTDGNIGKAKYVLGKYEKRYFEELK
ncbi:MAG: hypothetical protein KAH30_03495 [Caldisericia bacterium]|nr:hypothetical protein [Caldisericia bacterium]